MDARSRSSDAKLVARLEAVLGRHLAKFFSFQAKVVQGDDIEAIHDMRVASRRLQEVVSLATFLCDEKREALDGFPQIRRVRRALGRVRDLDVGDDTQ